METLKPDNGGQNRQTNGEWLVKTLKPAGCVLVLALAVLMVLMCLNTGRDPIKGYSPPQTEEYYALHLDELQTELEENVFPRLGGEKSCAVEGGRLRVTVSHDDFVTVRSALLRYYSESLLDIVQAEK